MDSHTHITQMPIDQSPTSTALAARSSLTLEVEQANTPRECVVHHTFLVSPGPADPTAQRLTDTLAIGEGKTNTFVSVGEFISTTRQLRQCAVLTSRSIPFHSLQHKRPAQPLQSHGPHAER
mmetsp:Transcript_4078/g.10467  ORF Transcript_4078/g.10467 Transcript_4078/m.10467 type:complete len:122 (-) Transcript_4078:498-863(-)